MPSVEAASDVLIGSGSCISRRAISKRRACTHFQDYIGFILVDLPDIRAGTTAGRAQDALFSTDHTSTGSLLANPRPLAVIQSQSALPVSGQAINNSGHPVYSYGILVHDTYVQACHAVASPLEPKTSERRDVNRSLFIFVCLLPACEHLPQNAMPRLWSSALGNYGYLTKSSRRGCKTVLRLAWAGSVAHF